MLFGTKVCQNVMLASILRYDNAVYLVHGSRTRLPLKMLVYCISGLRYIQFTSVPSPYHISTPDPSSSQGWIEIRHGAMLIADTLSAAIRTVAPV